MDGTIHFFERLPGVESPTIPVRPVNAASSRMAAAPLIGVIRNPRSHRNKGRVPELAGKANVLIETPRERRDLTGVLAHFADRGIDYLAVDGGDGTVRDVLTAGTPIFGDRWPTLIVLPKGKTNALAVDLGLPTDWNLSQAIEAAQAGKRLERRPLVVSDPAHMGAQATGFVLGAGIFDMATSAGQDAHRFGAFDSLAVGVTTSWSIIQALFGGSRNPWRQGTRMRLRDGEGRELPHCDPALHDTRWMLFASTIERFPVGIRPFGNLDHGLRLAAIDTARRSTLALLPALMAGLTPRRLDRRGVHRMAVKSFRLEIEDRFILDGEAFPGGNYLVAEGPKLRFVVP